MYAICTINSYTLAIKPNGGSYNGSTDNTIVTQNYNSLYGLLPSTKTGYKLSNWSLSGGGTLMKGISSGKSTDKSGFSETLKTDTDGTRYTNYSVSSSPTANTWYSISYPHYTFTAGHTYKITLMLRVNELSGGGLDLRHSCVPNDYSSTGRVATVVDSSTVGKGWKEYTLTRTYSSTTIASSNGNSNVAINPTFEIYTSNLINQTVKMNFDIKNIVITDTTSTSYAYSNDYIYRFGTSNGEVTASYNANTYTIVYNANGGSGTMSNTTATYDKSASISANTFTRTGYTFAGWTTKSDGTDDGYNWTGWSGTWKYLDGQYGISGGKLNLYARWSANSYTISYDQNHYSDNLWKDSFYPNKYN